MTLYKNITTQKIEKAPLTIKRMIKDKDGKDKEVTCFTNDEALILAAGYEKFVPERKPELTLHEKIQHMKFSKKKLKSALVKLDLWTSIKSALTEDEYEDLMLSSDFNFEDDIFNKVYYILKNNIENIDELLLQCRA